MDTLVLIGFLGGLITGISPCILPVLPVIFFAGTPAADNATDRRAPIGAGRELVGRRRTDAHPVRDVASVPGDRRAGAELQPGHAGSARRCSRCCTCRRTRSAGSGWSRWSLIGLGLIFPRVERAAGAPVRAHSAVGIAHRRGNGFGLGLALGVLYVPCAGPVLAAIIVAGATGADRPAAPSCSPLRSRSAPRSRCWSSRSPGRGSPSGSRVPPAPDARSGSPRGVVMIVLALALMFNLTDALQRALPDYTAALQTRSLDDRPGAATTSAAS